MVFDFDRPVDRRGTLSYKWDQLEKLFGASDVLPLWVADMDFPSPPEVVEAIRRRAEEGVYGYTIRDDDYTEAILGWFRRRHGWEIPKAWLVDTPGVVTSLSLAVDLFTDPGDRVILQSPVYYPFYDVIRMNGREVAKNPLVIRNGRYETDWDQLEELMRDGARMMLLCNPHNPGGRVWSREELVRLGELAGRYGVFIASDEIHCDLVFGGRRHVPFASLSEAFAQNSMTCLAPTKTFNLPGIPVSFAVIPDPERRRRFATRIKALSLHMTSFFAPTAVKAAYGYGADWLDATLDYVRGNVEYAMSFFAERLPELKPMRPEGTYLLWVDCRALGLDAQGIKDLMFRRAKVAFNEGSVFGSEGEGFVRINLACPRATLKEALERFTRAAEALVGRQTG
jgi:cystathionine beta-lyase